MWLTRQLVREAWLDGQEDTSEGVEAAREAWLARQEDEFRNSLVGGVTEKCDF